MSKQDAWLLPQGIEELLPAAAKRLDDLHRKLIDQMNGWGYELVMTPFVDYMESLLIGSGNDLKLQTFRLTDQVSGRQMGIRADMTPQVARMDAHQLRRETPTRLCYIGTVLHTLPDAFGSSRSPMQCGAELYGSSSVESDVEVIRLMLATLAATNLQGVHIDIAHVGIFGGLVAQAGLNVEQESLFFDALQRKAIPEIDTLLAQWTLDADCQKMLRALVDLNGGAEVLTEAKQQLSKADAKVQASLENLCNIIEQLQTLVTDVPLFIDLAELRGYHYHTGVMFDAYVEGHGQAVAWGGRYDDIGGVFGNARPATGFSTDLKRLLSLTTASEEARDVIFAPAEIDADCQQMIDSLRANGECVVCALPGQVGGAKEMDCSRILKKQKGQWQVIAV